MPTPVSESQQAIFDAGTAVGESARKRFPGGTLVAEPYYEHAKAVETTGALLAACPVPPLYEAAFTFEGIRIRADILVQGHDGGFDLVEVKSSTGVKPEHIPDMAIQLHVLQNLGVPINNAYLMHINNRYVYPGGDYNLEELFTLGDVTAQAQRFVSESVPGDLGRMWEALEREARRTSRRGDTAPTRTRVPSSGIATTMELGIQVVHMERRWSAVPWGPGLRKSLTRRGSWISRPSCPRCRFTPARGPIRPSRSSGPCTSKRRMAILSTGNF